ncbi:zinc-binding dehydrogenase [Chloroflexota bacterium]
MKAWQFYSLEDWRLEEVPIPSPGQGEVLLRVKVVQASITHVAILQGAPSQRADHLKKILAERGPLRLFGNEFSGEVVEVGKGVTRFKPGDRVARRTGGIPCGRCALCLSGQEERCRSGPSVGFDLPGCFSEYGTVSEKAIVKIPDTISFQAGACIQPLGSPLGAVIAAQLAISDTVAILGTGNMGFNTLQLARMSGAGKIYVTARRKQITDLALQLGADEAINVTEKDPVKAILELTDGLGADVVFECAAGNPAQGLSGRETIDQALAVVRNGGKIVIVSAYHGTLDYDVLTVKMRGVKLLPPVGLTRREGEHIVYLLSKGYIKVEPLITHAVHGLEKLPEAVKITGNKREYGAILPCQVIVD